MIKESKVLNLRILLNILFLLALNLLIKPFWSLGIDLQVQNKVGAHTYGTYQALLSLSLIFSITLDLGIQTFNSRQVANAPNTFQNLFPNMLIAKIFLAIIYGLVLMLLGYWLNYRGGALFLLFLVGCMQVAVSFLMFIRTNIAALQKFNYDSILSVTDKVIAISLCGYFLYFNPEMIDFSIYHFALFQVIGYTVTLFLGILMTLKFFKFRWLGINLKRVGVVIKKGIPYAILVFFMGIYARGDMILLDVMTTRTEIESGIYAASYRLLDLSNNMLGVLIASILMPLFVKMTRLQEHLIPVLHSVSVLLACASIWLALWVSFYAPNLVSVLYDDHQWAIVQVITVLFWVLPFSSMSYIYSTLLTAGGYLKFLIITSIVVGVLSLLLNYFMIPHYGAWGSAFISIIAHALYVIAVMLKVRSIYNFKWPWKVINRIVLWGALTTILFYWVKKNWHNYWFESSLMVGLVSLIFMIFLLGIRVGDIRNLLSKPK